jgi:hypothetical protein
LTCDLERVLGPLAARVPTVIDDRTRPFIFSSRTLPVPPESMETDRLVVRRGNHFYGGSDYAGHQVDAVHFHADRETYRHLGLLILAVLFHEKPTQVDVKLRHPTSDIKQLVVVYEYPDALYPRYQTRPVRFRYDPWTTERHPWYSTPGGIRAEDLPSFELTTNDWVFTDGVFDGAKWAVRDLVHLYGSDRGFVNLAELLLNAGRPDNPVLEYNLEDEGGFRGVGVHSAEVTFWLPGSVGWDGTLSVR